MMKAVIVDDEADARENLSSLLKKYCNNVEVVGEADSAVTGFHEITNLKPELVFLDIQMPGGTGLDLLDKLRDIQFEVIFVTAYDEYALKAIKFAALDYILKPINFLELKAAVEKASARISDRTSSGRLKVFLENRDNRPRKIALSTSEGIVFAEVSNIIRCEARDTYTIFHFRDGKPLMISGSLKEYESLLAGNSFFRIHQSHLVNMEYIRKYIKGAGGEVVMSDGSVIGVARAKKQEFLEKLAEFHG